jgi:hypothetical protein
MKLSKINFGLLLSFLVLSSLNSLTAQVIAVVNKADWCPTCKANGPRVSKEVLANFGSDKLTVIENDLSNKRTKEESKLKLAAIGLEEQLKGNKTTGIIILFDPKTKKELGRISVAKSNEEIETLIVSFIN